jgi:tellurite resistance protein TerB
MPIEPRNVRQRRLTDPSDLWTPGDTLQMEAVVAACVLVAQADGWVTPEERSAMIRRMRTSTLIAVFDIGEIIAAYEALNARFDRDLDDGEAHAEAAITALSGQPLFARLLIETACSVAESDGGFDGEEWQAIVRICRLLDQDPADFDLVPSGSS